MDKRLLLDQAALRVDLTDILAAESGNKMAWAADVRTALEAPGKLLSLLPSTSHLPVGFWALLPLTFGRYLNPDADPQSLRQIALSCELLLCSLDYYDEIEDNDESPIRSALGDGRLLNSATALETLARRLFHTHSRLRRSPDRANALLAIMDEELLLAMHGQHMDMLAEGGNWQTIAPGDADAWDALENECLEIAAAKAGSLVRMVCRLAATAVSATDALTDLCGQVGTDVGIASQIENDAHDLEVLLAPAEGSQQDRKSDLERAKRTLPMVLASRQYHTLLQSSSHSADGREQDQIRQQAYQDGILASLGVAVLHRMQVAVSVQEIERAQGVTIPLALQTLLGVDRL